MKMIKTSLLLTFLFLAQAATAGTFKNDKCMKVHFAWGASDLANVANLGQYSYVYIHYTKTGEATVPGYPHLGTYNKAGKNITTSFFDAQQSLLVTYDGLSRSKNETCYVDDSKACYQGTMVGGQSPGYEGVWEGLMVNLSNCQ